MLRLIVIGQSHAQLLVVLSILPLNSVSYGSPPDVFTLRGSLERVVRELDSCHVVAATRGNQVAMGDAAAKRPITFFDMWFSGDCAQLRRVPAATEKENWWDDGVFRKYSSPISTADLEKVAGLKGCVKPDGPLRWAEWRDVPVAKRPASGFPSLYSCSAETSPIQVFYLPYIGVNRSWMLPERSGSWLASDHLVRTDVNSWRIVGTDKTLSGECVVIEANSGPTSEFRLKDDADTLSVTPLWKAWFVIDREKGFPLIRVQSSARYGFRNREYSLVRDDKSAPALIEYVADHFVKFSSTTWFPRNGRQRTFAPDPRSARQFDADRVSNELLSSGKFVDDEVLMLQTSREWHILQIEPIEPNNSLWFDAPINSCVHRVDTEDRYIEGVSREESDRRLGLSLAPAGGLSGWRMWRNSLIAVNILIVIIVAYRLLLRRNQGDS